MKPVQPPSKEQVQPRTTESVPPSPPHCQERTTPPPPTKISKEDDKTPRKYPQSLEGA